MYSLVQLLTVACLGILGMELAFLLAVSIVQRMTHNRTMKALESFTV